MTLQEQIVEMEALVEKAQEALLAAQIANDPLVYAKESALIDLQTQLNALQMRKPA